MMKENMMKNHKSSKNGPKMEKLDTILEQLAIEMDKDFMRAGKALAELYRAVCTAAAKLPTLELHTELMCVQNSDDELTVIFHRDAAESGMRDDDEDDDDPEDDDNYDLNEEEEEGMLYDAD